MTNRALFLGFGLLALVAGVAVVLAQSEDTDLMSASDYPVDIAAGADLYGQYCASCHGANLEGQEDWRSPGADGRLPAPPHDDTGHTWHHIDSLLFTYTKLGGKETLAAQEMDFDSGMPGFGDQLSDEEIWKVLSYIKSTWPERISTIQAERTAADIAAQGE
jgi:mono/diheme cytochrome c family protein